MAGHLLNISFANRFLTLSPITKSDALLLVSDHTILLPFDAVVSTILSFAQGQQTFGSTAASQLRFQIKEVLDAPQSVELEDLIVSCLKHPHAAGSLQWLWEIQRRVDQFMQGEFSS